MASHRLILWAADIRRFGAPHQDTTWVRNRTIEAYGKHYTMAWPHEENSSARPCRRSPLYGVLKEQGACFGEKLGWERPNWFADIAAGETAEDTLTFGKPNWFEANRREHTAIRESAVLIDQTSFAKYVLKGPDACVQLNQIAANNIDRSIGSVIYTQMLNHRGGIECDLTITRISEQEFYIVTGTGFATHDFHWINKHLSKAANCQLIDVSSAYAVLSLMGPSSRNILERVCVEDVSNDVFRFATAKRIGIAGSTVLAMRISYVGELGWELHIPVESALSVYAALMEAGSDSGLINAGYRAIESCRLEKGYRAWGADIGPDHTPVEAGLLWAADPARKDRFIGRDALLKQITNGVAKQLVCFSVDEVPFGYDPAAILFGRETIYRNGERVGWLSSAGYGHTLDKAIGFGYVRHADGVDDNFIQSGSYEIEVENQRVACKIIK